MDVLRQAEYMPLSTDRAMKWRRTLPEGLSAPGWYDETLDGGVLRVGIVACCMDMSSIP